MNLKYLALFSLFIITLPSAAQEAGVEYEWEQKKDSDQIKIYTSTVPNSPFKAVRGEMLVKASVASLVALVEDVEVCDTWADLCRESRVEKRVADNEAFIYVYNDIPFPVSDRDVYAHVIWSKDSDTQRVSMNSEAHEGGPAKTSAVRIENAVSQWHFTPLGDGTTKVESFAHIDPNGPTPAWITNLMLISSPHKSMRNMREIVESGTYADTEIAFLDKL